MRDEGVDEVTADIVRRCLPRLNAGNSLGDTRLIQFQPNKGVWWYCMCLCAVAQCERCDVSKECECGVL
jgi:hypothetical protein